MLTKISYKSENKMVHIGFLLSMAAIVSYTLYLCVCNLYEKQ